MATLQDALNTLGYNAGAIDGIFGTNTKNAVLRYQRAKRLAADGIVGCNTWRAITTDIRNRSRLEEIDKELEYQLTGIVQDRGFALYER